MAKAEVTTTSLLEFLTKSSVHLARETVHIKEWDRDVELQAWTSRERDEFEADSLNRAQAKSGNGTRRRNEPMSADLQNFRARLVSRTIIEDGAHPFGNPKGEELLGNQPASILDKLFTAAQKLHGMSNEDVENLVGNVPSDSETITADDSSFSSLEH